VEYWYARRFRHVVHGLVIVWLWSASGHCAWSVIHGHGRRHVDC
jgi:hypothetical protein